MGQCCDHPSPPIGRFTAWCHHLLHLLNEKKKSVCRTCVGVNLCEQILNSVVSPALYVYGFQEHLTHSTSSDLRPPLANPQTRGGALNTRVSVSPESHTTCRSPACLIDNHHAPIASALSRKSFPSNKALSEKSVPCARYQRSIPLPGQ